MHPHLIDKALASLVSVMLRHKEGPCREPDLLRVVLIALYDGKGWADYEAFFDEATRETDGTDAAEHGRFQTMRSAYARIARKHGRDYW